MLFTVTKASEQWKYPTKMNTIVLKDLDDLMKFIKNCGHSIIMDKESITIYDDYVE